ncbi:symmetrical bis(5'-nucleosyl)-tetraphosphatase [Panacagrimonas sp.]|uniref:symmetrical bis(5'-nucleosyl)-tetraphosphatase n=1 Tax=Panacagrimonas sp. TaxID=2480088 RepID=UPI003B5197BB
MATYAIGDIQGCYDELQELLTLIRFDVAQDHVILVGDLVNRGPRSLQVLRFVRALGSAASVVLGNHDLHLLAVSYGARTGRRDTLDEVLAATDRGEVLDWLARQPLALLHEPTGTLMVHAGVAPQWSPSQALELADEASRIIRSADGPRFLMRMYGDEPDHWDDGLRGIERARFVVNCLTRLRYCGADGRLDLRHKGAPGRHAAELLPWFQVPGRLTRDTPIVFGHWSTLGRIAWPEFAVHGLDTGCVWGGRLTALQLETGRLFDVPSRTPPAAQIFGDG